MRLRSCFATILIFSPVLLATLIALSRVFIGVHYLTDVVAGMAFGAIVAIGIYYLCQFIIKKFNSKKEKPTE